MRALVGGPTLDQDEGWVQMSKLRGLLVAVLVVVGVVGTGASVEASAYLDHTFGEDGVSRLFAESVDVPDSVRVVDTWRMSDGRIVVAGDISAGTDCDVMRWWIGRFGVDGQPDPTFGSGTGAVEFLPSGVSTCFTATSDPLRMGAVAVQSTGKIVVGGGPNMTLVRLNADGSPDPSFPRPFWPFPPSSGSPPQCVPFGFPRSGGEIWDLVIDPLDDTVLAAGRVSRRVFMSGCPGSTRWGSSPAVFRYDEDGVSEVPGPWGNQPNTLPPVLRLALLADGTPVAASGTSLYWLGDLQLTVANAYVPASSPENDIVGLVVDSQDRVTLATLYDDYETIALHRFGAGAADPSFGNGGEILETALGRVDAIAADSLDRLVLTGRMMSEGPLLVARLDETGALDPSFGDGGVRSDVVVEPAEEEGSLVYQVAPIALWTDAGDQPVVFGLGIDENFVDGYFVVGRYQVDGTPDPALDDNGFRLTLNSVTTPDEDDATLTELEVSPAGETYAIVGGHIVKWRADGSVDDTFSGDGRLNRPSDRSFADFVVDHSGDLVVVGNRGSNDGWVGRYDGATGAPDPTFGSGGRVNFTGRTANEIAVDSADRPIVAVTDANPTSRKLIRLGTDGSSDPTYGTGGVASAPVSFVAAMTVDSADRVAVSSSNPIDVVRFTSGGAIDASFTRTTVTGFLQELLVDPSDRLIPISSSTTTAYRFLPGGGLDPSFAQAGRLSEPSQFDDPHGTVDAAGRLVLSGKRTNSNDISVLRYTDAGVLDATFATNGRARLRPTLDGGRVLKSGDRILADIDSSGRIVVGVRTARPSTYRFGQVVTLFGMVPDPPADAVGPEITIAVPLDGATYLSTDPIVVAFSCADVGSDVDTCTGEYPNGASINPWPGPRTFVAYGTDLAGNSSNRTSSFTILDAASTDVAAGGSVATGDGNGLYVNDALDTRVTSPIAGTVTIVERSGSTSPPGYELAGWQADITAPAATSANPLRLTFWLDSSALGALDAMTVQIFRNGTAVPPCDEPATGVAAPDPCVVDRQVFGDGDAALDVLTSAASTWTFGRMLDATPPTISIASPVDGALFTLGQVVTADYACADGGSGLASCAGPVASGGTIDTATAGATTFTVTASDAAGNSSTAMSTYEVLAGSVTATATGPAVVNTDPGGLGASPGIPVQTRLDVAPGTSGEFSLAAQAAGSPPAGYVALSTAVGTSGPAATAASPHAVTFTLDASMVGELLPAQVEVIANGALVATCGAGSGAVPAPCVASRIDGADGDVVITVRTAALTTWTFARRSFIVTSATPSSRAQGTSAQTVLLAGDGFQPGATARISGSGVPVATTTWLSPSSLQLTLNVGASTAVGARNVTVTNPNNATAVCTACFAVVAKPTVSSLSPASRPQGTSHATIQLTGTGLQNGAAVSFAGTGVSVHSVTYIDATRLDLDVSIDATAGTGARAVTVVNPDGGAGTKSAGLTVNATPTITTVAPTNLRQGQSLNVVVNGTGFPANFVVGGGTVSFGDGVIVTAVVRNSPTKLTVSVSVDAAAVPGVRTVTVTNPDTGTATCASCVTVVVDPQITTVAPASRARATTAQAVTISGSGFQPGAVVKLSGTGITVTASTVVDPSTVTVQLSVGASATLGARDVTVTNPDSGMVTCGGCFTVNARPTIGTLAPASGARGSADLAVQVPGTGFQPGVTVSFSGAGVTATVVAVTPTSITLAVNIDAAAPTGQRSITVTNPDAGTLTKANAFRIT